MDRYVLRESRFGGVGDYPQGNQMMSYPSGSGNIMGSHSDHDQGYLYREFVSAPGQMTRRVHQSPYTTNFMAPVSQNGQVAQVTSGIDPGYLSAYADSKDAAFITGQRQEVERRRQAQYANTQFNGQYNRGLPVDQTSLFNRQPVLYTPATQLRFNQAPHNSMAKVQETNISLNEVNIYRKNINESVQKVQEKPLANNIETSKTEFENPAKLRAEKRKALFKSGPRVFSGPVENVLKWHKALQDIGILIVYEIVAKCVSVRAGEGSAKVLVIRDESGPAIQAVYYELDFLLPELTPPVMIRLVGRMLPGSCRLQAFRVRQAHAADVTTLPRRAALAHHHVTKLAREYGPPQQQTH